MEDFAWAQPFRLVRRARRTVARARHHPEERPRRDGAARAASLRTRTTAEENEGRRAVPARHDGASGR